ncbi:MAG TPA: glycosyltransferase family 4 protein, partial [Luteolibacter sp.]
ATSVETARVLERMGAPNAVAVFPDAYDVPVDVEGVMAGRREQLPAVGQTLRLLWQGRALWWKCPDLALEVLAGAVRAGVRAELTMVGDWSGEMGAALKDRAARLGIADRVTFLPGMKRDAFLALQAEHHAFLATSLHDSGGIPLIEAQARGLPCLTLGLGGNRVAACSDAGVPDGGSGPAEFVSRSVACLKKWQDAPGAWLIEAEAALRHSKTFTNARLQDYVRDHVVPAFEA